MATKSYENGASKRKRQKLQEKAVHSSRSILEFLNPSSRSHDGPISHNESSSSVRIDADANATVADSGSPEAIPFSGPYAASDESLAHVSQVNIENESTATVTAAHGSFYEG